MGLQRELAYCVLLFAAQSVWRKSLAYLRKCSDRKKQKMPVTEANVHVVLCKNCHNPSVLDSTSVFTTQSTVFRVND